MKGANFFKGSRRDDWRTPKSIFEKVNNLYSFSLDLAASKDNRCVDSYLGEERDSLKCSWGKSSGVHWLNPPFSKATAFFSKAALETNRMIAIYKAANLETKLWQDVVLGNAAWVCFLKGRVNYVNHRGEVSTGVTFGSAIIGYRVICRPEIHSLGKVWALRGED